MKKSNKNNVVIWIVTGYTGEYEDRRDWHVAAYFDESVAKQHRDLCEKWYIENNVLGNRRDYNKWDDKAPKNPYDPNMEVDSCGTNWGFRSVVVHKNIQISKELLNGIN